MHGFDIALILLIVIGISLALLVHFLPSIIAFRRDHEYRWPILIVNTFLGWSVIGWALALAWAAWPRRTSDIPPALP